MNEGMVFSLVLVVIVLILSAAIWYREHKTRNPNHRDPQLQAVHDYLNESITTLLAQMERKIEDHFEDEYDEGDYLLQEQLRRQRDMVTDFSAFCVHVSGYPGWGRYVKTIEGMGIDLAEHWDLKLATSPTAVSTFSIPLCNVAHLIDKLTIINDNNQMLIDMIKSSEQ